VIKLFEFQEEVFLEMADAAIVGGTASNKVEAVAAKLGYFPCAWCKERGNYPSEYLKKEDKFSSGVTDTFLNGHVCNECISKGNDFSY